MTRLEQVVDAVRLLAKKEFIRTDLTIDLSMDLTNGVLKTMRDKGLIKVIGGIKRKGRVTPIYEVVDLDMKPGKHVKKVSGISFDGLRGVYPQLFTSPVMVGTRRIHRLEM